jgi:hypothetical protein
MPKPLSIDQIERVRASMTPEQLQVFAGQVVDLRSAAISAIRMCNSILGLASRDERPIAAPVSLHSLPASLPGDPPRV